MRNKYLKISELFDMMRNFYINKFPQKISDTLDMKANYTRIIIDRLNNGFMDAKIELKNGRYEVTGDIVEAYIKSNPPEGSIAYIIKELSDVNKLSQFISDATKDLEDFDSWLKIEGFVKEGLASEKLIKQKNWFA
ncbi:Hypothetical protein AKI40_3099 [Enterobacter sp. FY-07]|uniref:hypothetical protein n=1 Tax=Kosakonia oryzendophytica TaxID=1005665 RepID=UPI000777A424|nr:hypothetical protein [Kosakonia oryzendophytica]AMO49482.1 Hypothetical protein AKI40_3099 [Enterobacter sp. FY-07]WBT56066.1 hypothetical protein O9K67_12705 [Kosakonia oryzendophytica]WBT56077.1 hypothetical protein O9K67_12770 [Kosakonia oryzendophytica]